MVFKTGYVGDASGLAKIDENFRADLAAPLAEWNQRPANGRTLVIEPVVDELSFKHGAKRVLLGPLAGSSGVLMHVSIHDANGNVIANPEFFQRAGAMGAGFTFGVHDNMMLTRVGKMAAWLRDGQLRQGRRRPDRRRRPGDRAEMMAAASLWDGRCRRRSG